MTFRADEVVVMKFGGTSIGDAEAIGRVLDIITARRDEPIVVMFSAISEATNILTQCAVLAAQGKLSIAKQLLENLQERHKKMVEDLVNDSRVLFDIQRNIDFQFEQAQDLALGLSLTREFSLRSLDFMVSFGELVSSSLVAAVLRDRKLPVEWINARSWLITNDDFGRAAPQGEEVKKRVHQYLFPYLIDGHIPVTQGYIGQTVKGIPTTLGREGSDYSAAILANALDACRIEIWTDVNGILTADPQVVRHPLQVRELSYEEAAEITLSGAKVLHPGTLQPAVEKTIPIRILNSHNAKNDGTWIKPASTVSRHDEQMVKSIAFKKHVNKLTVVMPPRHLPYSFVGSIYNLFDKYEITIETAATSHHHISLTFVDQKNLDHLLAELKLINTYQLEPDLGLITVVGANMAEMASTYTALFNKIKINPLPMITFGASDNSFSLLVPALQVEAIVRKLHHYFFGVK